MNRRSFLTTTCLAAGGSVLLKSPLLANTAVHNSAPNAAFAAALSFIRGYATDCFVAGGSAAALAQGETCKNVSIIARLDCLSWFTTAMARVRREPFDRVLGHANCITFTKGGCSVEVQNLPKEEFLAAKFAKVTQDQFTFAHEALQFDPRSKVLRDPLMCNRQVRLQKSLSQEPAKALQTVLAGFIAAEQFHLSISPSFDEAWNALASAAPSYDESARDVAAVTLRTLASRGSEISIENAQAVLSSRLVRFAAKQSDGIDTIRIVRNFESLRSTHNNAKSLSTLWIAAAFGAGVDLQTAGGLIDTSSPINLTNSVKSTTEAQLVGTWKC